MNAWLVLRFRRLAVLGLVLGFMIGIAPVNVTEDGALGPALVAVADDDDAGEADDADDADDAGDDDDADDAAEVDDPAAAAEVDAPDAAAYAEVADTEAAAYAEVADTEAAAYAEVADTEAVAAADPVATATDDPAADDAGADDVGAGESICVIDDDGDESTDDFCAGQAIVRLKPTADVVEFNRRHQTRRLASIPSRNVHLLRLPQRPSGSGAYDEGAQLRELQTDGDALWAELNFTEQAPEGRPQRFYLRGDPVPGGPGDSYAPSLLGVDAAHSCAEGRGVTVAVIDSGIDARHPAFAGRLVAGRNVLPDRDPENVADVGNDNDDDGDGLIDEMVGHGTHVAGVVVQVAPEAKILPIRALDSDGVGTVFFVAVAIYHAMDSGVEVINLSLGSTQNPRVTAEAVAEAVGSGIFVAAAAGNENRRAPGEYPAIGAAFGVASTERDDGKSDFTNFHPNLDLSAPGREIVSAFPNGRYVTWSGTSMATPWVSGAAALLLEAHPNWRALAVRARLEATAAALNAPDHAGLLGTGRLDVGAAVACGAGP